MNIHIFYHGTVTWGSSAEEPSKDMMAQNGINFKKSIFTASGLFMSISKSKNMNRAKSLEDLFFSIKQRFRKDAAPSDINPT